MRIRVITILFCLVAVYFLFHLTGWINGLATFFASIPAWMYVIIAGILFSGYKVVEGVIEDRRADYEHIEKEGQRFLDRIEEERKQRRELQQRAKMNE